MNRLCTIALAALVLGTGGLLAPPTVGAAHAAEKGKAKARKSGSNGKASRPRKAPAPKPSTDPAGDPPPADQTASPPGSASAAAEPSGAARAGKTRVYTFGGLDLEGKLRTPQLLYFRGRMRQELDASSLQRRSFLKELEKTADDQGL